MEKGGCLMFVIHVPGTDTKLPNSNIETKNIIFRKGWK